MPQRLATPSRSDILRGLIAVTGYRTIASITCTCDPVISRHRRLFSLILIDILLRPRSRVRNSTIVPSYIISGMRAVLIKDGKGPVENLYIGEASEPVLRDGEVLVKVKT